MKNPELKQRDQQFWHHLGQRAKYAKGWDVRCIQRKNAGRHAQFTCLHGKRYSEPYYIESMEPIHANPKGLADQYFRRAIKWCKGEHIDLQVNTWYSTGPPKIGQLLTIASASTKWITLPANWTGTITWNPPDYINTMTTVYGGGTKSIVGELLDICPGLGKVQRPCPECKAEPAYLTALIPHVNDSHQWSREKIAEWLDNISMDDPAVDFTIQPKEKKDEQPSISPDAQKVIDQYYGTVVLAGKSITKIE